MHFWVSSCFRHQDTCYSYSKVNITRVCITFAQVGSREFGELQKNRDWAGEGQIRSDSVSSIRRLGLDFGFIYSSHLLARSSVHRDTHAPTTFTTHLNIELKHCVLDDPHGIPVTSLTQCTVSRSAHTVEDQWTLNDLNCF